MKNDNNKIMAFSKRQVQVLKTAYSTRPAAAAAEAHLILSVWQPVLKNYGLYCRSSLLFKDTLHVLHRRDQDQNSTVC